MNDNQEARLMAHAGANLVTREQLAALPEVVGTDSFKPVAHYELVISLEKVLADRGIAIREVGGLRKEQFAISKDGMRLFGTMDLIKNGIEGTCASLGFRTANNKTMSLKMVAGVRVFVCDNMALSGDTIVLSRKHTSGLVLLDELVGAMDKYEIQYSRLKNEILSLQGYSVSEQTAKLMIYDLFAQQIMPVRYFPEVVETYFEKFVTSEEPKYAAFAGRTGWSLLNAFTEVAKLMPLTTRVKATQLIGKEFGKLVK
jgi:hypothetical protein